VLRTLALIEARDRARGLRADLFQPDPHPGERPGEAETPRRKPAKTAKAKHDSVAVGRRTGHGLRSRPPLVSRRPRPTGEGAEPG
jgi:hypothetical protein